MVNFGKRYTSCSEMPLYNFIKVIVTNELKWVSAYGFHTREQLEKSWEAIFEEYMTLSKDTSQNYLLSLIKEITFLTYKLNIIQVIVDELAKGHDEKFVKLLQGLGFRFKFDPDNAEQYAKDLKLTVSQSKAMLIKIKDSEHKLSEMKKENKPVNEGEYDIFLSELSKFQGYRIDPKVFTVSEFVAVVNRFKADIEMHKKAS